MIKKKDKELFNTIINYNLYLFNLVLFSIGIYLISLNFNKLQYKYYTKPTNKFKDCDNIFLLTSIGVINNMILFISCNFYIKIFSFIVSSPLCIYNIYTINYIISKNCKEYYINQQNTFWNYYNVLVYFQIFTLICHIIKIILYITPTKKSYSLIETSDNIERYS
jgi:hypothetical protein